MAVAAVAVHPDREVSGAVADDGVGRKLVAQAGDDLAEVDGARHRGGLVGPGQEVGMRRRRRRGPGRRRRGRETLERGRKGGRRCVDGQRRAIDPAELLDAGIDMHERLRRARDVEQRVALRGHLAEPAADQDDEIGLLHAREQLRVRADAEVAGVAGVPGVEEMRPAERGRDRQREALGEALHRRAGRGSTSGCRRAARSGACASLSSACSRRMSAGPGEVSTGSNGGASAATTRSTSMSSGSAITTGPGRPAVAV